MKLTKEEIEAIENAENVAISIGDRLITSGNVEDIIAQLLSGAEAMMDKWGFNKVEILKAIVRRHEGEERNGSKKQLN